MNGYSYDNGFGGTGGLVDQNEEGDGSGMMMMGGSLSGDMGGQSLDEIVSQNAKMIRRQSMPQGFGANAAQNLDPESMRRISMLEYGNASPSVMHNFQYDPNAGGMTPSSHRRAQSANMRENGDLSLNTTFGNNAQYNAMMAQNSPYAGTPNHPSSGLDMGMKNNFLDNSVGMNMDYTVDSGNVPGGMSANAMQMNLYGQPQFNQATMNSPMHPAGSQGTPQNGGMSSHGDSGGSSIHSQYGNQSGNAATAMRQYARSQGLQAGNMHSPAHGASPMMTTPNSQMQQTQNSGSTPSGGGFSRQPQHPQPGSRQDRGIGNLPPGDYDGVNGPVPINLVNYNPNSQKFPWEEPPGGWPSTIIGRPHTNPQSQYKNAYSTSGFDMLGVLVS